MECGERCYGPFFGFLGPNIAEVMKFPLVSLGFLRFPPLLCPLGANLHVRARIFHFTANLHCQGSEAKFEFFSGAEFECRLGRSIFCVVTIGANNRQYASGSSQDDGAGRGEGGCSSPSHEAACKWPRSLALNILPRRNHACRQ